MSSSPRESNVRRLVLPPLLVLLVCLGIIGQSLATTGGPFRLGWEFQGGTVVTLATRQSPSALEGAFSGFPLLGVREAGDRILLQFGPMEDRRQLELSEKISREYGEAQIQQMGEVMGRGLQEQTAVLIGVAFSLMALVVFATFRKTVPVLAVLLSAAADISAAVAFMRLSGTELSFGTLVALVMLIGYSVDTDIMLTNRLLRRGEGGDPAQPLPGAPRGRGRPKLQGPPPEALSLDDEVRLARTTGLTMTGTTIAAVASLLVVSSLPGSPPIPILRDISLVLLVGLVADMVNTWMLNAGLLLWWLRPRPLPPEAPEEPPRGRGRRSGS